MKIGDLNKFRRSPRLDNDPQHVDELEEYIESIDVPDTDHDRVRHRDIWYYEDLHMDMRTTRYDVTSDEYRQAQFSISRRSEDLDTFIANESETPYNGTR